MANPARTVRKRVIEKKAGAFIARRALAKLVDEDRRAFFVHESQMTQAARRAAGDHAVVRGGP